MAKSPSSPEAKLGYWSTVAIGIGGMVGGGIFAVLGLAVQLAHGGAPLSFLVAGGVALLTAYSYARLSVLFPSQGGTVEFLNQAFGPGLLTGASNILLWLSYIVMLSLYAHAFGSYGATLLSKTPGPLLQHSVMSFAVIFFTLLNGLGAAVVGLLERWIVGLKLIILLFFVGVGFFSIAVPRLALTTWASPLGVIAGGMVIFLAYEGFELIANTAADVKNPQRTLPRAYFSAVGFVIVLYVLVATVTLGNLDLNSITAAKDYALAVAAKPFLGPAGFILIAIAAVLSTGSAINATLYGAARLSFIIAKEGELPAQLEKQVWRKPIEGLLITAGLTLLLTNLLDLSSIAVTGSAGFLIIFAAVNLSAFRLHRRGGINPALAIIAAIATLGALAALIYQQATTTPINLLLLPALLIVSFALEYFYRLATGRTLHSPLSPPANGK